MLKYPIRAFKLHAVEAMSSSARFFGGFFSRNKFTNDDKMSKSLANHSPINLGVVPTHLTFADGIAPTQNGDWPRDESGQIKILSYFRQLVAEAPVSIDCAQISQFAGTSDEANTELVDGLKALGLEVQFIMMVGEGDPMNPADEDTVVQMLVDGLNTAQNMG